MFKKILTTAGMMLSSGMFTQSVLGSENATANGLMTPEQLEAEIAASCGQFGVDTDDFKQCVEIVSIDFAVIPHNGGGTKTCTNDLPCEEEVEKGQE